MSEELGENDVARKVAESLSTEFGQEIVLETEKQLADGAAGKRSFLPGWASDAAAMAGIILGAIQLVKQLYSDRSTDKKLDEIKKILEASAPHPERINAATRSKILQKVIQNLRKPDTN